MLAMIFREGYKAEMLPIFIYLSPVIFRVFFFKISQKYGYSTTRFEIFILVILKKQIALKIVLYAFLYFAYFLQLKTKTTQLNGSTVYIHQGVTVRRGHYFKSTLNLVTITPQYKVFKHPCRLL